MTVAIFRTRFNTRNNARTKTAATEDLGGRGVIFWICERHTRRYTIFRMFRGKKIVVVMPAYNAARTLQKTHAEVMEQGIVDEIVLVDDASADDTIAIARGLPA